MRWREETEEEIAAREAEWNAVYVRCRTCHFGSIETEFGEDQCPDCSSTMFVPVEPTTERQFGIEVDVGNGPVRPIWRVIEVRIPDGEIPAAEWNRMTVDERREFLDAGIGGGDG